MNCRDRLTTGIAFALSALLLSGPALAVKFRLPIDNAGGTAIYTMWQEDQTTSTPWIFGVDHDPSADEGRDDCLNYNGDRGLLWCYDGHTGTDFMLAGGFDAMDDGSAPVLAAADGVVVHVEDGHYDRCHGDINTVYITCDGHEIRANYIEVDHGDGYVTLYYHLMKNSMFVEAGDSVVCGQPLALIGSSGISTAPHLHFQFEIDGEVVDPFAGPESQPESYWVLQDGDYGLPGEYCEGDPLPGPDVVEPAGTDVQETEVVDLQEPDVVEPVEPDVPQAEPDLADSPGDVAPDSAETDGPYWWNDGKGGFSCSAGQRSAPTALVVLLLALFALLPRRRRN